MCSCTDHLGGKITKSAMAVPFLSDWQVRTVKIEGSLNSETSIFIRLQLKKTYLPSSKIGPSLNETHHEREKGGYSCWLIQNLRD